MKDNQPHARTCGAKTRAGTPCQKPPLEGRKRCKLHGGATPRGVDSPHYQHGKYSRYLAHDLRAIYRETITNPDVTSLRHEIGLLRTFTARRLELWPTDDLPDQGQHTKAWYKARRAELRHMRDIGRDVDRTRRLVESQHRIVIADGRALPVETVMILMCEVIEIIRANVPDQEQRNAIAQGLSALLNREATALQRRHFRYVGQQIPDQE